MIKGKRCIKVLILDSDPSAATRLINPLGDKGGEVSYKLVDNEADFVSSLNSLQPDLVISNYHLPQYSGLSALKYTTANFPFVPFIFIAAPVGEEKAVEAIRLGAFDFLLKSNLHQLPRIVERALKEAKTQKERSEAEIAEAELHKREEFFREILNNSFDGISIIDSNGNITYQAPSNERITGYSIDERVGSTTFDNLHPDDLPKVQRIFSSIVKQPGGSVGAEVRVKHKNGHYIVLEVHALNLIHNPMVNGIVVNFRDVTEQITAQEALKKNEHYFRKLFENAPLGIVLLDAENHILQVNKGFRKIFKYEPEEILHKNIDEFIAPPSLKAEAKDISKRAISGEIVSAESVRADKNGMPVPVYLYSVPIEIDGKIHGFYGIYVDISNQKTILKELEVSRHKLIEEKMFTDASINSLPGIFYVSDESGKMIRWNRSLEEISGYTSEEIAGMGNLDFVAEDDKELVAEKIQDVFENKQAAVEAKVVTKTGEVLSFFLTGFKFISAGKNYLVGTGIDITQQEKNRKELQLYANLQAELATFSKTALTTTSLSKILTAAVRTVKYLLNADITAVLRFDPEKNKFKLVAGEGWGKSAIGNTFFPLGTKYMSGYSFANSASMFVEDIDTENRFTLFGKPQKMGMKSAMCTVIHSNKGKKFGLLCAYFKDRREISEHEQIFLQAAANILSDAIHRIASEKELEELTRELTKYNEELEHFAYVASHNLRAPVANLAGLVNLFNIDNSPEHKKKIIAHIGASVDQLDETLTDLVETISSNKKKEKYHQINFEHVLQLVLQSIGDLVKESRARIVSDFSRLRDISYPIVHLQSILQNTITNAIKYRKPGHKATIHITTENVGDAACLTVSDNGLGIDLDRFGKKLFHMYQRFHTDEGVEGKGLGLYIVKSQVESLGGRVEVESEVGKGTTFRFYLNNSNKLKSTAIHEKV